MADAATADYAGWAFKQGSKVKNWKKRYFVLRGRELIYYGAQPSSGRGEDEKGHVTVVAVEAEAGMLLITCERKSTLLKLKPLTPNDLRAWLVSLQTAVGGGAQRSSALQQQRQLMGRDAQYHPEIETTAHTLFGTELHDEGSGGDGAAAYAAQQPTESVQAYYKTAQPLPKQTPAYGSTPTNRSAIDGSAIAIEQEDNQDDAFDDIVFRDFEDSSRGEETVNRPSQGSMRNLPRGSLAEGNHIGVAQEGWVTVGDPQERLSWKKRYAVLAGPTFTYFASKGSGQAIESVWVTRVSLSSSRSNALDLVLEEGRVLGLAADSREDLTEWERALASVLGTPALLRAVSSKEEVEPLDEFRDPANVAGRPSSYTGVFREGWLMLKQGFGRTEWERRYFVLNGATLQERDSPTSQTAYESFVVRMTMQNDSSSGEFELELMSGRYLLLRGENTAESEAWIHALSDLVGTPPAVKGSSPPRKPQSINLPAPVMRPIVNLPPPKVKKTGWLMKEGGLIKSWKRRYFILEGDAFHYFDKLNGSLLGGGIVFRVVHNSATACSLDVHFLNGRILRVSSETRADIDAWYEALRAAADASLHSVQRSPRNQGSTGPPDTSHDNFQHGWLLKRGQMMKTWKRRYFLIQRNRLMYYDTIGGDLLGSGAVFDVTGGNQRPHSLDVRFQNGRLLHIAAADDEDYKQWFEALKLASNISESVLSQTSLSQEEPLFGKDFDYDYQEEGLEADGDDVLDFEDEDDDAESSGYGIWDEAMKNKGGLSRENSWDSDASESNNDGDESDGPPPALTELSRESSNSPEEPRGCSGWLRKVAGIRKNWKRRFFTLHGPNLKYFKSEKGSLLRSYEVVQVEESPSEKYGITIVMQGGRRLLVAAESNDEYEKWLLALWGVLADQRSSLAGPTGGDEIRYSAVGVINVRSVPTSPVANSAAPAASKSYSGWLEKEGQKFKTWKRRYFTVKNGALMYFSDIGGETQGHGTVHGVTIDKTKPNTLRILLERDRVMRVTADTSGEMNTWFQVLSASKKSPLGTSGGYDVGDDYSEVASSAGSAAMDRRSLGSAPSSPAASDPHRQTRSRFDADDYLKNDTITNESFLRIRGAGDELSLTSGSFYKPRSFKGDLPFEPKLETANEAVDRESESTQLTRIDSEDDLEYLRASQADRDRLEALRKKKEEEDELLMMPAPCAACCIVM